MKKSRKSKHKTPVNRPAAASPAAAETIRYLRLCHACLFLNDDFREIEGCQQCGHRYSIRGQIRQATDWHDRIDNDPEGDENLEQPEKVETENPQFAVELAGLSVRW